MKLLAEGQFEECLEDVQLQTAGHSHAQARGRVSPS